MKTRHAGLAALVCALSIGLGAQPAPYDLLIRAGRLVDGTGNPWFAGDVAVKDGRIAAVGRIGGSAARTIDATGLIVAPGFIDLHTHSDTALIADGSAQSKVRQGVTVDVLGESTSVAPRDGLAGERPADGVTQEWTTLEPLSSQSLSKNQLTNRTTKATKATKKAVFLCALCELCGLCSIEISDFFTGSQF